MATGVRRLGIAILIGGCAALSACGGGGGGSGAQNPSPTPTHTFASPTGAATAPTPSPSATQPPPSPTLTPSIHPTASHTPTATPSFTPSATLVPTGLPTATQAPTETPTAAPPPAGPIVAAFGVADASGALILHSGTLDGKRVYPIQFDDGFIVFVEGRPGPSGLDVGIETFNRSPFDPRIRPDLEIVASRDLGNGSEASCDNSAPDLGGVPGLDPPDFSTTQEISDLINDFSCRFRAFDISVFPCTQDTGANLAFVDPNATVQFCALVSEALRFPAGDTVLTARLRDSGGAPGPTASIIVRVAQGQ